MSNTNDNSIFIQYNSSYSNTSMLTECSEELKKHNICIQGRDLNGTIMHSSLDFIDYEFIEFAYELIQTIILSGCYDIIKFSILNIWSSIRPRDSKIPFTIKGMYRRNYRNRIWSCIHLRRWWKIKWNPEYGNWNKSEEKSKVCFWKSRT